MYRFNVGRFNRLLARAAEANADLDLITATRALALAVKMLPMSQKVTIISAACDAL